MVSAQIEQGKISDEADALLGGAGYPFTSPNKDPLACALTAGRGDRRAGARPERPAAVGLDMLCASAEGRRAPPDRADTFVDIPGAGRQKINAAYTIGGAALAIRMVERTPAST